MQSKYLVDKAIEVLAEYPLCDHCLGRMFARLSLGHTNSERGRALKLAALMELHRRMLEGEEGVLELLRRVAPNAGQLAGRLYEEVTGERLTPRKCYVCNDGLEEAVKRYAGEVASMVSSVEASSFLIGARVPRELVLREEEIKSRFGLSYGESVKSELKREIGKAVQNATGLKPDFERPDVMAIVDLTRGSVELVIMPVFIKGVYRKLGRMISQAVWLSKEGRRYSFSVQEALQPVKEAFGAEDVVLHAAGREDVDARMLGTGRPAVVEVKRPSRRKVDLRELAATVKERCGGLVEFGFEGLSSRREVSRFKEDGITRKVYRVLVMAAERVEDHSLGSLERAFTAEGGVLVKQRTPLRVLHRRPDILRKRRVYAVRVRRLSSRLFEALVYCDGGLYVKELVTGDDGRTTPSFSEVLGVRLECLELDVVYVELERFGLGPGAEPETSK